MNHNFLAAIDWVSIKINAFAVCLALINPDPFIKGLTVLASCVTIGYNAYRWWMEIQKNKKPKADG